MSSDLRDAMLDAGLLRGGEVARRIGLTPVWFEWGADNSVNGYPIEDVDAIANQAAAVEVLRKAIDEVLELDICDCWEDDPPNEEHARSCAETLVHELLTAALIDASNLSQGVDQ